MPSYIERTLGKDEQVLVSAKASLKKYWGSFAWGGLFALVALISASDSETSALAIVFFLMAIAFVLPPIIRRMTNEMALTNRRLVAKVGLISLRTTEIKVQKIEGVQVRQTVFGRILNYGTITVTGTGSSHAPLFDIDAPVEFRRQFEDALEDLNRPAAA